MSGGRKTLLLVEDEAMIALAEAGVLKKMGFEVKTANSGEEAVALATGNHDIDLVLMDIDLGGGMDGTEAARRITSAKDLPILFLSSHSERHFVESVRNITRYGYVLKSSGDCVLESAIHTAFDLFEARQALIANQQRLQYALEGSNDGLWDVIMATGAVYLSKRGCEILGYAEEELPQIARTWSELVHPDDLPSTLEALNAYLEGRAEIFRVVQRLRTKSGRYKLILTRGRATSRDAEGRPIRMVGTHTDLEADRTIALALGEGLEGTT